jgi:hypothetical protein
MIINILSINHCTNGFYYVNQRIVSRFSS